MSDKKVKYVFVSWVLIIVALFMLMGFIGSTASATQPVPGQCIAGVNYIQRYQFMPTAYDTNEYLKFINTYNGCDVHISYGTFDSINEVGYYIWYKLPPLDK